MLAYLGARESDGGNPAGGEQCIEGPHVTKQRLREGINVWVAPEGKRSRDGELLPFKKGGFHLARQLGVSIIPTWIEGTGDILPPGETRARLGREATVRFGAPVQASDADDVEDLIALVRARMLALRT